MPSSGTLEAHIKGLITFNGCMPLDQFLSIVIPYYYRNNVALGRSGDFITAPEASQMFGEIIGIWAAEQWLKRGQAVIELVELGPGNGLLMSDLLRATKNIKSFHSCIKKIHFIEISNTLKQAQQQAIEHYNIPLMWHETLNHLPSNTQYIIIANEFFDALPIKQFLYKNNVLYETYVGLTDDILRLQLHKASVNIQHRQDINDNEVIEIAPTLTYHITQISNFIKETDSAALIIDYGYTHSPKTSTLQAIKGHQTVPILEHIGNADITSLVNFHSIIQQCQTHFISANLDTQAEFLTRYHIKERAKILIQNGADEGKIQWQLQMLLGQHKMGEAFKVLELQPKHYNLSSNIARTF